MASLLIVILLVIVPFLGTSQNADSLIVKNLKTNKEHIIQPWHKVILSPKDDSLKTRKFYGSIVKQSTDSIWVENE